MSITDTLNPTLNGTYSPLKAASATPRLESPVASALPPVVTRLFPQEAEALLQGLVQARWRRLSSEYDDPLGMLFGNRARQWTAGWDGVTLYLLVWETDSWQEKPVWNVYRDGVHVFQEEDGFSQNRSHAMHQLLESDQLPQLSRAQFLEPLADYRFSEAERIRTTEALLQTLLSRPELFEPLKNPLFALLERELGNPQWPLLEILKVHRVAHKVILAELFHQCLETGLMRAEKDYARLEVALSLLRTDFAVLNARISPIFAPLHQQATERLIALLSAPTWRKPPQEREVR